MFLWDGLLGKVARLFFIKNNYYFIAIRGVLRSRLYKINQNELFFNFFLK